MLLSIIIINYKTAHLTLGCISSIVENTNNKIEYEIIVVDNNSNDDSEGIITKEFPQVKWINSYRNEGFGRGNNLGVKNADGRYLLFINSDIIVLPNTIEICIHQMQRNDNIGVLGCNLIDKDGSVQKSEFPIASFINLIKQNLFIDKFFKLKDNSKKAIMGSFMFIPKNVFVNVGGFDPDFFMYSEEIELCNRILQSNYEIYLNANASVIHYHGASSNKNWANKQRLLSNALLFYKLKGIGGYFLYHFLYLINIITNFLLMFFIDKPYRKSFFMNTKFYYSNFFLYFSIPLLFKRKIGNGRRFLKRN